MPSTRLQGGGAGRDAQRVQQTGVRVEQGVEQRIEQRVEQRVVRVEQRFEQRV